MVRRVKNWLLSVPSCHTCVKKYNKEKDLAKVQEERKLRRKMPVTNAGNVNEDSNSSDEGEEQEWDAAKDDESGIMEVDEEQETLEESGNSEVDNNQKANGTSKERTSP